MAIILLIFLFIHRRSFNDVDILVCLLIILLIHTSITKISISLNRIRDVENKLKKLEENQNKILDILEEKENKKIITKK